MNFSNQTKTQIDQEQFKRIVPNLNDSFLNQLIQKAKEQGISEQDIQSGLQFIKTLK